MKSTRSNIDGHPSCSFMLCTAESEAERYFMGAVVQCYLQKKVRGDERRDQMSHDGKMSSLRMRCYDLSQGSSKHDLEIKVDRIHWIYFDKQESSR